MEHSTVKKILIGLFFCMVLFVASFFVGKKQNQLQPQGQDPKIEAKVDANDVAM